VLNNQTTIGEKFLVADAMPLTLPEIFTMLRKAQGRKPGLVNVPPILVWLASCLSGHTKLWNRIREDLVVETAKLESLGWRPAVETYEGLRSALSAENGECR
jgi:nucleoside-diphosphate-sugar epimerase